MQISINWLSDYVDLEGLDPDRISTVLTNLGLEVETIENLEPLKGPVVVGRILSTSPHPNAEKLQLCKVDAGNDEVLDIVCGAPNAREGLTVCLAKVGSELPGSFKIKPTKIRGEKSAGMLCSEQELGLSDAAEGIMELSSELKPGTLIASAFNLNDTVLTLGLTPNRADCLGYTGIARDLAAALGRTLKLPDPSDVKTDPELKSADHVTVKIGAPEDCGRFSALYIDQVRTVESPLWMKRRLEASGMRPINLIVDITNYAMLEQSQPIHAYDERDLQGALIEVRRARAGETLVTLDGETREIGPDDLVIADKKNAVGLAGVMGGANSEVKADTSAIVVEVAHFSASLVRKTARRTALHSEASHRFERGVNIHNVTGVSFRVAQLLQLCVQELQAAGADLPTPRVAESIVDVYPEAPSPARIAVRLDRIRRITGDTLLSQQQCRSYLEALGFNQLDQTEGRMLFEAPGWRLDIEREVDLIEEIARLHGYDKIPFRLPMMEIGTLPEDGIIGFTDQAKISLAGLGMTEIISFPFMSNEDQEALRLDESHPWRQAVALENPLAADQGYLQTTPLINLLKAVGRNRRHGDKGVRLFEICRCFYNTDHSPVDAGYPEWTHLNRYGRHIPERATTDPRPVERTLVGGIIDQPLQDRSWTGAGQPASFYDAKALVQSWLGGFGMPLPDLERPDPQRFPWLHPGASAVLTVSGKTIGWLGELHPEVALAYDLSFDPPPVVFELDLENVYDECLTDRTFENMSTRFPPVTRDLAFLVDRKICHGDFARAIAGFKRRKHLSHYSLFDVYEGQNIPGDKKSLAYAFSFQSDKKTLTDKEVEKEINALKQHLKEELSADLR